jgi:hypothetical protein
MADQLHPVLGAAKARWHLLHTPQRLEERLVEQIAADAQDALHQAMGAVGQAQVPQAGVMPVPADRGAGARLQPQLVAEQLNAAADRALVHCQRRTGPGLGAGQLQQIEHVQIQEQMGRCVAA